MFANDKRHTTTYLLGGYILKILRYFISLLVFFSIIFTTIPASSKAPRSKFYDFNQQLIDGEVRKPTALFTDRKDKVKFDRLLSLKKSFVRRLLLTSKERVFK
jgi:hypothetical protein